MSSLLSIFVSPWALLLIACGYFVYKRIMLPFEHFLKRGIAFKKPWPILGTMGAMTLRQESMFDTVVNAYNEFKGER